MQANDSHFETLKRHGQYLAAKIISHDALQLAPKAISPAIARRFKAGLRALEAYLRRLLLLLALALEPSLVQSDSEYVVYAKDRKPQPKSYSFPIFTGEHDPPDTFLDNALYSTQNKYGRGAEIIALPLFERFRILKSLLNSPDARARRLAFQLARKRAGPLQAPGAQKANRGVPRRYGTEISALYDSMGFAIHTVSRTRPKHIGPAIRAGPRIRRL